MRLTIVIALFLASVSASAFPLRHIEPESVLKMDRFAYEKGYKASEDKSPLKMLFVWDSSKRLGKKQYQAFKEFCDDAGVPCIAVDLQAEKKSEGNVTAASDPENYTKTWGMIVVPVTLILNSENRIIEAVGYEGQYKHKMSELIDSLKK